VVRPLPRCDALQFILYQQFAWPKGHMAKAVLLCNRCDAEHNEKQWRQFQRDARWYPTAGLSADQLQDIARHHGKARAIDPTVRSYWRNGFNSLLPTGKGYKSKLHEFVAEGESAKTSPKKLKTWKNEVAAELWDPSTEGEAPPPWKPIYDRREDYGLTVPAGGLFLTAFVDCQLNRLEIGWRAWGRNEESWGMDHVVLDGHVRDPEVWQMLRHELARKWQHESTAELTLGMAFVDGGHYAEDVYRFFQNLARNPVPE
jgi:phage terminase large subunit GpA-like protein